MDKKTTQRERVKRSLVDGDDVCQIRAIEHGWGLRLAAVVCALRQQGWAIESRLDRHQCAHYYLKEGWEPPRNEKAPTDKEGAGVELSSDTGGLPVG